MHANLRLYPLFSKKRHILLLHKNKVDSSNKTYKSGQMIPMQLLSLEHDICDDSENNQRHDLLNDFQLHKRERSAIALETNFIGRHLHAIFKEGYDPRKCYYTYEWPSVADVHLVKFQMTVPRKCHKHVCSNEQKNRIKSVNHVGKNFRNSTSIVLKPKTFKT